ncbi:MAG TPA: helix-turn-helix transcriptional regulator [Thermoanaerobaculia bacterium]|nr:helix-turn-helix transcriptional regulator [Thermoanaerobaculia bacterium]
MPRSKFAHPDAIRFGKLINDLRRQHEWTMQEFSRRANMTANYLSLLERGLNLPSLTTVIHLASVLGVDPGELVRHVAAGHKPATRAVLRPLPEDEGDGG